MLHLTNGDSAASLIREAGFGGIVLPWRDVLHEGPVPAGFSLEELREVRARFIAGQGWAPLEEVRRDFGERDAALAAFREHEEVVLWFEHDLYDQLQLIQLLDWFAQQERGATRLSLVGVAEYLGTVTPERIRALFPQRSDVSGEQLSLGTEAWAAFRSPDPAAVAALLHEDTSALPFLAATLRRHLQQFPSVRNGLSRSEQQALEAIANGRRIVKDAYVASHHQCEEAVFLGDTTFAEYLCDLSGEPEPLVLFEDGQPIVVPSVGDVWADFWSRPVILTDMGRAVLSGKKDRVRTRGLDRWLGGVHLLDGRPLWRWDEVAGRLRQTPG